MKRLVWPPDPDAVLAMIGGREVRERILALRLSKLRDGLVPLEFTPSDLERVGCPAGWDGLLFGIRCVPSPIVPHEVLIGRAYGR